MTRWMSEFESKCMFYGVFTLIIVSIISILLMPVFLRGGVNLKLNSMLLQLEDVQVIKEQTELINRRVDILSQIEEQNVRLHTRMTLIRLSASILTDNFFGGELFYLGGNHARYIY